MKGILDVLKDKNFYTKELSVGELYYISQMLEQAKKEFPMEFKEEGVVGLANLCGARAQWFRKWFGDEG